MIADIFHIPALLSLIVIVVIMGAAAIASIMVSRRRVPDEAISGKQVDRVV
jgi:hypothetical protein